MRETAGERTGCRASVTTAASTPRSSRARCKFGPQLFTSASITLSVRRRVRELRDARQRRTPACAVCVRRIRVTFVSGEAGERRPPSDDTRRFADTRCDAVGSWRLLEDKQPFLLTARGEARVLEATTKAAQGGGGARIRDVLLDKRQPHVPEEHS